METSNNNNNNGNHLLLDNTKKNTSNASSSTPIEANNNNNIKKKNNNNNNNNTNDDHRQTPTPILQQQQQGASSTLEEKSLQHSSYNQQTFSSSSLVQQTQNHPNNDDEGNENNNNKKKHINKHNNSNNNNPEENNKDFLSNDDEEDANNNNDNKSDSSSVAKKKKDDKKINDDDDDINTKNNNSNNSTSNELHQSSLQQSSLPSLQETAQRLLKLIRKNKIKEMNKFFQDNHNTDEAKKLFQQMVTIDLKEANLFHHAALRASREVFSTLLQVIEKYGKEFAKQLFDSVTKEKETVFHCAVTSTNEFAVEKYEALFNFAKEILDEDELKKLLLKVDNNGRTACTCIVSYVGISFEMSKLVIETHAMIGHNYLDEVAHQIDGWGKTLIMWAAEFKSGKNLKLFINIIKQHGGGELELLKKVLGTPLKDCSAGLVIVSAFQNGGEPLQALQVIFDAFKEIGGMKYLREMVLSTSGKGTSIFMTICQIARSAKHLKIFVDIVRNFIHDDVFFLSMLRAQDICGSVALHYLTDKTELNQALARYFCSLLVEVGLFSEQFSKLRSEIKDKLKLFGIHSSFADHPLAPKQQGLSSQTARKMNSTNHQQNQHQKALVALATAAKINNNNIDENNTMDNNNSSSSSSSSAENNNKNNDNNDDENSNGDNTVEELKKQVKKLEDTNETEKKKNKNIITSLQQQVVKLKANTEIAKKELASVRKQAEEDRKTLKAQIVACNNTIAQKEGLYFQQTQKSAALQRKLDTAVKARDKMESNNNDDDNNNNDDYDVVDEEESLFHQLHQQEIKFKEELEEARRNTASALAALNDLHEQHNNEKQQFEMEKTERKNLEQKLKGAEAAFDQHKKTSDKEIASLKKQLEAANMSGNTNNKNNNNSDDNVNETAAAMKAVEKERDELQKLVKEFKEKEEDRQKQLKNEQLKAAALQLLLGKAKEDITNLEVQLFMAQNGAK